MIQVLDDIFSLDVLDDMLAEVRTLPLVRDQVDYPKCGVFTEASAPLVFRAMKLFAGSLGKTLKYVQINSATLGDGLDWHNDEQAGTDSGLMLYLTKDKFSDETGGYLEMGVSSTPIGRNEMRGEAEVAVVERVYPRMGLGVLFDNTNLALVHRLEPLRVPLERYTVLSFYGS